MYLPNSFTDKCRADTFLKPLSKKIDPSVYREELHNIYFTILLPIMTGGVFIIKINPHDEFTLD